MKIHILAFWVMTPRSRLHDVITRWPNIGTEAHVTQLKAFEQQRLP
jgi:hypothetical protein